MPNPFLSVVDSLVPEPQASLLNGILFGVKSQLPKPLYNDLVTTGTLHITALSGMNITILANLTAQTTLFLGRKASSILTLCLIVFFTIFVGGQPSIVRAAIMGCLSVLAVYFGRKNFSLYSLFLAAVIMLIFDHKLIKNIAFQLSFLSTFGIILANKSIDCQRKKSWFGQLIFTLKQNLRLTFSAQIFTLPIILINFRRFSLIAPLANVLIEWVIQPIMVLGFISAILGWLWLPLGMPFAWLVWVPLTYLIGVVETLAKIPGSSVQF